MFLFTHSDHTVNFYVLPEKTHDRMIEGYIASCESVEKIMKRNNRDIKYFELMGHQIYSLVHVFAPALGGERATFNGYDLFELITHYLTHPLVRRGDGGFSVWLNSLPGIAAFSKFGPSLPMIARNYEGKWLYFFVENGKLEVNELLVTSVIQNGVITTLHELQYRALERARQHVKDLEDQFQKMNDHPYDLPERLTRSGITSFAKR